jgi:OOP family OmpA-OmpF porin
MKSTLLASILFALPIAAQAASGYIEGQVGYASIDDVDTKTFTSIETGSVSGSLDYDPVIGYGFEIGIRDFEQYNVLRVGLAWNRFKAELDSVSIDATGGTEIGPISGLDFDSDVDVYSANFYYDFPVEMAFKPYLGFGIGVADIENAEDKEIALIGLIGGQYEISESVNLGIKYQYINIDSFEDKLGIEYDDASASMISVTLGVNF